MATRPIAEPGRPELTTVPINSWSISAEPFPAHFRSWRKTGALSRWIMILCTLNTRAAGTEILMCWSLANNRKANQAVRAKHFCWILFLAFSKRCVHKGLRRLRFFSTGNFSNGFRLCDSNELWLSKIVNKWKTVKKCVLIIYWTNTAWIRIINMRGEDNERRLGGEFRGWNSFPFDVSGDLTEFCSVLRFWQKTRFIYCRSPLLLYSFSFFIQIPYGTELSGKSSVENTQARRTVLGG